MWCLGGVLLLEGVVGRGRWGVGGGNAGRPGGLATFKAAAKGLCRTDMMAFGRRRERERATTQLVLNFETRLFTPQHKWPIREGRPY